MIVYLCGPIFGRADAECKPWRELATAELAADGHTVIDPMRRDFRGTEAGNSAAIVVQDKADIDAADALLVYFDRPSVGTAMEILYAWERGKRIYVANIGRSQPSPWLIYHSSAVGTTLAEALTRLRND